MLVSKTDKLWLSEYIETQEIDLKDKENSFMYECYNDEYDFRTRTLLERRVERQKEYLKYLKNRLKEV